MIASRHFTKVAVAMLLVAVLLCSLAFTFSGQLLQGYGGKGVTMEYEDRLFNKDEPIDINIKISEEDWADMLENSTEEVYYTCDVTINGQTLKNVGIRPKGNTSLSSIANNPDTDRYSFKLEFDQFVSGQTCYGLDKLILNNNFADATNMKEAIVYDMYEYLGADASLYNFAKVNVNGEYWGIYLALEAVEDSFMLRNYGTQDGKLYKPDTMDFGDKESFGDREGKPEGTFKANAVGEADGVSGPTVATPSEATEKQRPNETPEGFDPSNMPQRGNSDKGTMPEGFDPSNMPQRDKSDFGNMPEGFDPSNMPGGEKTSGGGMNFGFGKGGGANLNYSDDDLDSYSSIWDSEITKATDSDHRRVVEALKNISEGNDLEKYMDVDNLLKYMAVHTFAVNMDSLSGNMSHNYYLYEYDGQLNILPWDYNLSLGGMGAMGNSSGSGASGTVNYPIDTPFSGTNFFDKLLENETYLAKYHEYLNELAAKYVNGGEFEKTMERITSQIDDLVKTDPNAFYTPEEYEKAKEVLKKVVRLRAESILGQLDGSVPSTSEGQKAEGANLIDASDINLSDMGQMMGGGGPNKNL